jgi:outer membrane protein OmpA-like peptidoglycan-associated protein
LGGAAIGAAAGELLGGGGDIGKGILVGSGGASAAWLYTHPHDKGAYRSVAYLASFAAIGTGVGWTICASGKCALAGGLIGGGVNAIWQASESRGPQRTAQATPHEELVRTHLIRQLNEVVQTRDTPAGVVASVPEVSFESNQATLTPAARERLARVAGVLSAYPGLQLHIEGFTDNTGNPEWNAELSNKRADAVRDFLVSQGVSAENVSAAGYGASRPIASNSTPEGRQRNRRVDLVLNGTAIGTEMASRGRTSESGGGTSGAATESGRGKQTSGTSGTVASPPPPPPQ